jgi:hypothetical protein
MSGAAGFSLAHLCGFWFGALMSYRLKKLRVAAPVLEHEQARGVVGRTLPAIGGREAQGKYFVIPNWYSESRKVIDLLFTEAELEELPN